VVVLVCVMSRRRGSGHVKARKHRAQLRGVQAKVARRLGEPTAFIWMCDDPSCLGTSRPEPDRGSRDRGRAHAD